MTVCAQDLALAENLLAAEPTWSAGELQRLMSLVQPTRNEVRNLLLQ
ncbi:hypothetical protein [Nostoc sphaeroides]|nr:hypothetical protein [Nostoc sphaeroides]